VNTKQRKNDKTQLHKLHNAGTIKDKIKL